MANFKQRISYLISKQVSPRSPTFLILSTSQVSVFHMHIYARRVIVFVFRVRGGTEFMTLNRIR